jgi:predicted nucleic acid-binding protein
VIILDTSVLVAAFRRRSAEDEPAAVRVLRQLIQDDVPIAVPGIVLQELLAGARTKAHFDRLVRLTRGFPVLLADRDRHRQAAELAARCRWVGLSTTAADCLIAAQAIHLEAKLFTLDRDFTRLAGKSRLVLFDWR